MAKKTTKSNEISNVNEEIKVEEAENTKETVVPANDVVSEKETKPVTPVKKDNKKEKTQDTKKAKKVKKQSKTGKKVKETVSELKKVNWPTFGQVCKKTGIVLAVVLIFAVVLFGIDRLLSWVFGLLTGI